MAEQDYFRNALSDFAFENASGGAIRHLADLGYTIKQITAQLAFPTPYAKVQQTVWEHLLDTKVIRLTEPGNGDDAEKADFIKEYDKYGKASFRKVTHPSGRQTAVCWIETEFNPSDSFSDYLRQKLTANCSSDAYVSCDFGIMEPALWEQLRKELNERQAEYLQGLPWVRQTCYHILDSRMMEILIRLYQKELYHGVCFFEGICAKVKF
ncbi:MAG: hypothetical protein NC429_12000 [Lachnospiraceae bacterium]|nr:hypothetical protein [Lachnospiraceae bacterium]